MYNIFVSQIPDGYQLIFHYYAIPLWFFIAERKNWFIPLYSLNFFFSVMFLGIFWLFRIILRPHHKVCCVLDIKQWQIYLYIMTVPFLQDIEEPGEDSTRFDCLMPTVVKPKAPSSRATYRGYPSYDSNQQVKVSPSLCQHESLPCPTLPSKPAAP